MEFLLNIDTIIRNFEESLKPESQNLMQKINKRLQDAIVSFILDNQYILKK